MTLIIAAFLIPLTAWPAFVAEGPPASPIPVVLAAMETSPVETTEDAADDAAIWAHPTDPERSLIIGTNKKLGLHVYDLSGKKVQDLLDGRMNNVDVVQGVATSRGERTDIVAASNRSDNSIALYGVESSPPGGDGRARLVPAPLASFPTGLDEVYGLCAWADPRTGGARVGVVSKSGTVRIFRIDAGSSGWRAEREREFIVGGQSEGMAADAATGSLYVGEESVGVWRYPLDPESSEPRRLIDTVPTMGGGNLAPDIEGITLYEGPGGSGYLIVSCQSEDRFAAYDRVTHRHLGSFRVRLDRPGAAPDRVTHTDGVAAHSGPLGARFPRGVLVVQDDNDGRPQNFKVVDWREIERALGLEDPPDGHAGASEGGRSE